MSVDQPHSGNQPSIPNSNVIVRHNLEDNNNNNNNNNNTSTPSSSTSTLKENNQSEKTESIKMSKEQSSESNSGLPDIKPKDFGIDENATKMPIEAEAENMNDKPPSFKSIEIESSPITNSDNQIRRNNNDDKDKNEKDESGLPIIEESNVEMIDGRPKDIYDRFTKAQKLRILGIVSFSAIIAPMTSSIFLPSIPQMAEELKTTPEIINYTVAVFIVIIGIAPVFWSPYAGFYGRRPIYLASMPIMVIATIGVSLCKNVAGLTAARIIQGIGSSCFLSVGAGSVGDIYRPTERSRGMAAFYGVTLIGPGISPAIAGIFTEYTKPGWRTTQYFLIGIASLSIFLCYFFLPETSHPPLPHETLKKQRNKKFVWFWCNPLSSLGLLRWPNILVACLISSCCMIDTYCVLVPLSSVFKQRYHINNLAISGSLYLASGAGNILGTKFIGPRADAIVIKWIEKRGYRRPEDRLRAAFFGMWFLMPASILIYGWLLKYGSGGIAPPLIMVFLNGVALMFALAPLNTYLVDAMQTRSAEVIAVNNFIRYLFAAAASACILPITNAIGWGITMTIAAVLTWISALGLLLLYKYGDKWRERSAMKYGVTTIKAPDEEVISQSNDEEAGIQSIVQRKNSDASNNNNNNHHHDDENHEHPVELSRPTTSTTNRGRANSNLIRMNSLQRQKTNQSNKDKLPNVEQVLKRTVSLSGTSVHGGG
ncbi:uncharacterized protein L201_007068 [Kwoniella dendrophila CBS 6074]|uniref:Major facilitator superfamily (MFS) profile domain-containing protein n=1 Tax=Kwoniella dendrophila CBS 6074 TaxID=1295534 RepID=A0AAX4K405_9TREE